jgi:para-nitrobenzyl esterase
MGMQKNRIMPCIISLLFAVLAMQSCQGRAQKENRGTPAPVIPRSGSCSEGEKYGKIIKARCGPLQGVEKDGIRIFRGIPFAKPPVGDLRWKPPQPPAAWRETRLCGAFAAHCPQPRPILGRDEGPESEDCLYLNIWAPAERESEKLPVMVWIHGGGFTTGSGSSRYYDGRHLARKGAVIVTINYRLGPFGFFAHPALSKESNHGVSGNYGILDMIAALKWVKENISSFGGDPDCVTIFGESAGSAGVTCLMASPLAKGLFHRAIAQSNFAVGLPRLKDAGNERESAEKTGQSIAARLGCTKEKNVLEALRGKSANEILQASQPAQGIYGKGVRFRPVVDGWVFPEEPAKTFRKGHQHPVPFIAGTNADEGSIFLRQLPIQNRAAYRLLFRVLFKEKAGDILSLYEAEKANDITDVLKKVTTDIVFLTPVRFAIRSMEKTGSPAYFYYFTRVPQMARKNKLGAFHALEISYIFGAMNATWGFDEVDRKLSETMSSYWVNFAKSGNPNGNGLYKWPAYTKDNDMHLELGDEVKTGTGLRKKYCDAIESMIYQEMSPHIIPKN